MKNSVDPAQMGGVPCVRHPRIPVAAASRFSLKVLIDHALPLLAELLRAAGYDICDATGIGRWRRMVTCNENTRAFPFHRASLGAEIGILSPIFCRKKW